MNRCLKYIKQDEGIDYIPKTDDIELPKMDGIKTAEEQLRAENVKIPEPAKETQKPTVEAKPTVVTPPKVETPKQDKSLKELEDKLMVFKERGNTHFKKQAYKEAIKHFSEGINLFETAGAPTSEANLKLVITQLLTNRSLSFHHLGQQNSALQDANYVLNKLDS